MESVPIDRGWAWMTVLGAAVCSFFFVGGIRSLGIILVEVVTRFSASSATASLIMAIVSVGVSVIAPISTALGERFTYRVVIMTGGALCALGSFLMAFGTSATYVIIVYGTLTGIGYGCIAGPSLVVVGQYFNQRRALANGLAVSGGSVGQLVIPLLMYKVIEEFGFMGGLMLYSAISLHVISAALLMRPFSFYKTKRKTANQNLSLKMSDVPDEEQTLSNAHQTNAEKVMEEDNNNSHMEIFDDIHSGDNLSEHSPKLENQQEEMVTEQLDVQEGKPLLDTGQMCDTCPQTTANLVGCSCQSNTYHLIDYKGLVRTGYSVNKSQNENQGWIELTDLTDKLSDIPFLDCDEHMDKCLVSDHTDQSQQTACKCGQSLQMPIGNSQSGVLRSLNRISRAQRQESTLSWTSVRSLEVVSHQDIPDSPKPSTRRGILCPEDILINCCCCFTSPSSTAKPLIPWSMFKDPLFILYISGICLGNSGYMNACLFLPAHAEDIGLSRSTASWLLSIMGIVDLVGRIGGGWLADLGYVSRSRILAGCLLVTGLATFICIPIRSYPSLVGLSVTMGLFGGCCVSLQVVVLVDFFGADKLSATCGLSIMCQGLINIFVPSLLGIIRDSTTSYLISFYICASLMVLSTVIFSFENCVRSRRKQS